MDIYQTILATLGRSSTAVLATIISSSGSTPLPTGAKMIVDAADNTSVGTVGGGLLEAEVIVAARRFAASERLFEFVSVELNDDASGSGMICGGNVEVMLEKLNAGDAKSFLSLLSLHERGDDCFLVHLIDKVNHQHNTFVLGSQSAGAPLPPNLADAVKDSGIGDDSIWHAFGESHRQQSVQRLPSSNGEIIIEPIGGLQHLVVVGAGHVSKSLCAIASRCGFSVTITDDRAEFAGRERFPDADQTIIARCTEAFEKLEFKESTSIVIVTRNHQIDTEALRLALGTPARYIGMIGSKRKVMSSFEQLLGLGIPVAQLKRVHAPIGLDIGAVTAEEIAVSIVAEMIRVRRNNRTVPSLSDETRMLLERLSGKERIN